MSKEKPKDDPRQRTDEDLSSRPIHHGKATLKKNSAPT